MLPQNPLKKYLECDRTVLSLALPNAPNVIIISSKKAESFNVMPHSDSSNFSTRKEGRQEGERERGRERERERLGRKISKRTWSHGDMLQGTGELSMLNNIFVS